MLGSLYRPQSLTRKQSEITPVPMIAGCNILNLQDLFSPLAVLYFCSAVPRNLIGFFHWMCQVVGTYQHCPTHCAYDGKFGLARPTLRVEICEKASSLKGPEIHAPPVRKSNRFRSIFGWCPHELPGHRKRRLIKGFRALVSSRNSYKLNSAVSDRPSRRLVNNLQMVGIHPSTLFFISCGVNYFGVYLQGGQFSDNCLLPNRENP